jgi:cytochrome P450
MLHNEAAFQSPNEFNPERFIRNGLLRDNILDPEVMGTFGFGRR